MAKPRFRPELNLLDQNHEVQVTVQGFLDQILRVQVRFRPECLKPKLNQTTASLVSNSHCCGGGECGDGKEKMAGMSVGLSAVARALSSASEKPWPDGLALACENHRPGQSHQEAIIIGAWPGSAYLGPAWLGSRPEAGPATALLTRTQTQHRVPNLASANVIFK